MSTQTKTTEGFVDVPSSDVGIFANAASGAILRKPDCSPPWIVVCHTLESALIARWPCRLWRVAVLDTDGIEQVANATYTRAIAVRVIEEIPVSRLFGIQGESVVELLALALRLDTATAEGLARLRHPDAPQASQRAANGVVHWPPTCRASLLYTTIWFRAEAVAGATAFIKDEDGERILAPVWDGAFAALRDALFALTFPFVAPKDAAILTAAWKTAAGRDMHNFGGTDM